MAILKTFDLKGNKLSFANWISNLSPSETPFTSMIGKESVNQTMYSWQIDRLAAPDNTAVKEGAEFVAPLLAPTQVVSNFTQILRKVVRITDTANKIGLYGRDSEKSYQMEKAGRELKRDLEWCVLHQVKGTPGSKRNGTAHLGDPREFSGFRGLVAPLNLPCADTGAVVHKVYEHATGTPAFSHEQIFDITYNLYLAGAKANKIMIHPKHMILFSNMIGNNPVGNHHRLFDGMDAKYNMYVKRVRDPLGQVFDVIPNRHMPENLIYFFNESDWTQMILRAPETRELARNGSSERHMIEMEVGLRHRNPYASGILELKETGAGADITNAVGYFMSGGKQTIVTTANLATKLHVDFYKNGAIDSTVDGAITIGITSGQPGSDVENPTSLTITAGRYSGDIKFKKPGIYTLSCSNAADTSTTVEILVHSPDRKLPGVLSAEAEAEVIADVVAAPEVKVAKGRKAK